MQADTINDISKFYVAGINYKKTDAEIRGQFAIHADQYARILSLAHLYNIQELFVLSTCNRTEIYGYAEDVSQLINLLCTQTSGCKATFVQLAYIKKGMKAIEHFYHVGAGLDSQILGDYEIIGQIKQAVKFSKQNGFIGSYLERLINSVLQSSKNIKNQTALSGGTVSVSFAAVQYIKQTLSNIQGQRILLLGAGKIGRSTCKNLVSYLGTRNIILINRTPEKAVALADELGLQYASSDEAAKYIEHSDIIIVATNADQPTILKSNLENKGDKLIIDLSIPYNVEPSVKELSNIILANIDDLSKVKDDTIKKREAEVPVAKAIINSHIQEFLEWNEMRKHVLVLQAVKTKLLEITSGESVVSLPAYLKSVSAPDERIRKVINIMALKMRRHNKRGCYYIEAINDFIASGAN